MLKSIYFYGLGEHFYYWISVRKELLKMVTAFIDKDKNKQERMVFGREVYNPKVLLEKDYDCIVITSKAFYDEIKKELIEKYFVPEEKLIYIDDFVTECIINVDFMPEYVAIEASTLCQLNCTSCYMRKDNNGVMGAGYLKFENFKRLVDENPSIKHIDLANNGEIFLNPDLKRIIEYAFEKDVELSAWGGVNFNDVSDEVLEALVVCEFRGITIGIDGACQDTYGKYRRNGDFNKVIMNIKKLNRLKCRYNKQYPKLKWQFVIMNHNQMDVTEAKYLAYELGMQIVFKATWDEDFQVVNRELLMRECGRDFSRNCEEGENEWCEYGHQFCRQLFYAPRINWDGRLTGCCVAYMEDFGINVFEVGLQKALKSESYMRAKRMLLGRNKNSGEEVEHLPCVSCKVYKSMCKNHSYIEPKDLMGILTEDYF